MVEEDNYDERLGAVLPFAKPLAPKKLNKRILKTVKRASKSKQARRGVKEVVKALRRGEKGLVVVAGDIWPPDVISHLPVLCEEAKVPYVFVPSKEDLGQAGSTKRPTSCIMITPNSGELKDKEKLAEFQKGYDDAVQEVEAL